MSGRKLRICLNNVISFFLYDQHPARVLQRFFVGPSQRQAAAFHSHAIVQSGGHLDADPRLLYATMDLA